MGIRAADIRLTETASEALSKLETSNDAAAASVARRVRALRSILLADAVHGEVVRKPLPRALVQKHGVENLYVEDLPGFWRLIYTIHRLDGRPFVVIVEIVDHRAYDLWFPGKGR